MTTSHCNWTDYLDDFMPETYETGCEHLFSFTEGDIKDNEFKFCPYCGGAITEITHSQEIEEEAPS